VTEDDLDPLFETVRLMQHHAASIPTPHDWHTDAAQRAANEAGECSVIAREAYDAIASRAGLPAFDQTYARRFPPDLDFPSWTD
jgi:hypothetical protein